MQAHRRVLARAPCVSAGDSQALSDASRLLLAAEGLCSCLPWTEDSLWVSALWHGLVGGPGGCFLLLGTPWSQQSVLSAVITRARSIPATAGLSCSTGGVMGTGSPHISLPGLVVLSSGGVWPRFLVASLVTEGCMPGGPGGYPPCGWPLSCLCSCPRQVQFGD